MMRFDLSHALGAFAGVLVVGVGGFLLGAARPPGAAATIDVRRINVREPDGALRMVISSAADAPGIIVHGREQPHPDRRAAGILFYNDEGTENGGLIFDGRRDGAGARHSHESLTFDRYEQDQVMQLQASEDGATRLAGLAFDDRPEASLDYAAIERGRRLTGPARAAAFAEAHAGGAQRAFVGRAADGRSELVLRDAAGKERLVLSVSPDGAARIAFIDAAGHVSRTIEGAP
ncbi:MAG TPA: hypothetical protein VGI30_01615 [Caulobacteraceae bacterium]|jgi:hypothetical protein